MKFENKFTHMASSEIAAHAIDAVNRMVAKFGVTFVIGYSKRDIDVESLAAEKDRCHEDFGHAVALYESGVIDVNTVVRHMWHTHGVLGAAYMKAAIDIDRDNDIVLLSYPAWDTIYLELIKIYLQIDPISLTALELEARQYGTHIKDLKILVGHYKDFSWRVAKRLCAQASVLDGVEIPVGDGEKALRRFTEHDYI